MHHNVPVKGAIAGLIRPEGGCGEGQRRRVRSATGLRSVGLRVVCHDYQMRRVKFPFSPRSATELSVGDVIAVPSPDGKDGKWTCLQVLELKPRARTEFVVGTLPWVGSVRPTGAAVEGLEPVARALTRIEIFTNGNLEVVDNVAPSVREQSTFYGHHGVGAVSKVWGWQAAIRNAQAVTGVDDNTVR